MLIKVGIFYVLDTLDSYSLHFGIIKKSLVGMFINRQWPMVGRVTVPF